MRPRVVIAVGGGAIRAALGRALAAAGFAVLDECADARAAVAAVARDRPDVCVLDAALPGGALVAAAAIASPPAPPSVLVVGDGGDPEQRAAELAGASYLEGRDDDRLVDTVDALLRGRNLERRHR